MSICFTSAPQVLPVAPQKIHYMHSYSATLICRRHAVRKRDGHSKIVIQCFLNGIKVEVPTGATIEPKYWCNDSRMVKLPRDRREEQQKINNLIATRRGKAWDIMSRAVQLDRILTKDSFLRQYFSSGLLDDFYAYSHKLIARWKGIRDAATLKNYGDALRKLSQFADKLMIADMTEQTARRFDEFMQHQGLKQNTRWKHHKNISKLVSEAVRDEILEENRWKRHRIKKERTSPVFLTKDELQAFINLYYTRELGGAYREIARAFLFAALNGGFRQGNWYDLSLQNIEGDTIIFQPLKARKIKPQIIKLGITQIGRKLIDDRPDIGNLLFPQLPTCQQINRQLKELAGYAGIKKNISSHTARHTYATQFLEAGGKVEVLQQILGHSRIQDTMIYSHVTDTSTKMMSVILDGRFNLPEPS